MNVKKRLRDTREPRLTAFQNILFQRKLRVRGEAVSNCASQDPELWDDRGDSLIFFGHGRTEPSFRVQSSLLRETGSDMLVDMLLYGTVRSFGNIPGVSHKIYMDPPAGVAEKIEVLRHHITTRNFFAFLQRKCLVGFTFYQALVDLHERLEEYLPPGTDCTAAMRCYLVEIGLVNVSNEPRAAAGLLAWSEDIRWNEGWREAFVHSVGMYDQLVQLQESADISLPTKAHLDRKYLELQVRIQEVQDCLGKWYFDDVHYAVEDETSSVKHACEHFRKFLKQHYQTEYEHWPLKKGPDAKNLWLDRKIILQLQEDFGAVYEYLVDRNVTWSDDNKDKDGDDGKRKKLALKSNSKNFWLDADDERMLRVFRNIDSRLNAPDSIPYPYPLLPASIPTPKGANKRKILFKDKNKDQIRSSRLAHTYNVSTNADLLGRETLANSLVMAFIIFEKSDQPETIDPREARRERWILLYAILSTLANITPDVPNLSFKTNVSYPLNTRLDNLPPWDPNEDDDEEEEGGKPIFPSPSRFHSHCYTSPSTWHSHSPPSSSFSHRSLLHGAPSHHSISSETSSNTRPLSPHTEGTKYAFLSHSDVEPPSPAPSITSFKHIGTKPSSFPHTSTKPKDFTRVSLPSSDCSHSLPSTRSENPAGESSNLSPLTGAAPFNNIFEPIIENPPAEPDSLSSPKKNPSSSSSSYYLSEPSSHIARGAGGDNFSDYSSAPPLTEASSSSSGCDSFPRNNSYSNHDNGLPPPPTTATTKKFAKLAGIAEFEFEPRALPVRARENGEGEGI